MCDCDGPPSLVFDPATSDEICTECGVVVDRVMFDGRDWGFDDAHDGSRVGMPGAPLGTFVSRVPGVSERVMAAAAGAQDPDEPFRRGLRDACSRARISVPGGIHTTADRMFEDFVAAKGPSGRSKHALAAACMYFACRLEKADRELRTVAFATGVEAPALNAAVKALKDFLLTTEPYASAMKTAFGGVDSLVNVYLGKLDIDAGTRKRLWRETHRVLDSTGLLDSGKKPRTIAASAIHAAAGVLDLKIHKKDIALASGVCAQTIC